MHRSTLAQIHPLLDGIQCFSGKRISLRTLRTLSVFPSFVSILVRDYDNSR